MSLESTTTHSFFHFSSDELLLATAHPIPNHVAIIMDGNRRWAKQKIFKNNRAINIDSCSQFLNGHWAGANVLSTIVEAASDLGIKVLTVYAFSTENWERSDEEIEMLLYIFKSYLDNNRLKMVEQGVRFHVIGDLTPFSKELKESIATTKQETQNGNGIDFIVALNYGGRDEIRRAAKKIAEDVIGGRLLQEEITETLFATYLDTAPFGDPDLLIRTSGEKRISNFLLWQLAYCEVFVTETLWPDFRPRDLLLAVLDFQKRQRRIGK